MNLFLFWVFALVGGGGALIEEQTMQRIKRFKFVFGFRNRHENVFKDLALEQLPNIDFFGLLENKILTIT